MSTVLVEKIPEIIEWYALATDEQIALAEKVLKVNSQRDTKGCPSSE